jgi:hypothetical protein
MDKEIVWSILIYTGLILLLNICIRHSPMRRHFRHAEELYDCYIKRCDSLQNEVWQLKRVNDSLMIELKYYEQHR